MADKPVTITFKGKADDLLDDIDEIGDGLSELDKKQARAAKEALDRLDNTKLSRLKSQIKQVGETLQNVGGKIKKIGGDIQSFGKKMTLAITAPLVALGTLGVRSALELDKARTKMIALTGSTEAAATKWEELNKIADNSVGVLRASAREQFNQLKGLRIADETINKLIPSLGKLNAAFDVPDMQGFTQNLNQIFTQSFERTDIKEAIGRVPIFEDLLEQAFGTADGDKLRKLKESGKLTLDGFLSGISEAINSDARTANVGENLSTKLAKGMERLDEALAPLGDVILKQIVPAFERITPFIISISDKFQTLSPTIQTVIVAVLGLVAAIGPALVVLGTIVSSVGTLISAIGAVAGALAGIPIAAVVAAIALVAVEITALIAAAVLLYKGWQANIGGVRDFTDQAFAAIKGFVSSAMTEIRALTDQVLKQIAEFWKANGEDIKRAAATIYAAISQTVKNFLDAIREFWAANGETIKNTAKIVWESVKVIVTNGVNIVVNLIKIISAVINGDWKSAWEASHQILKSALAIWANVFLNIQKVILNIIYGILTTLGQAALQILDKSKQIGWNIAKGIAAGIKERAKDAYDAATTIITTTVSILQRIPMIQSPSKVTHFFGEMIAAGLAVGMLKKLGKLKTTAKTIAKSIMDDLKSAIEDFSKFAGLSSGDVNSIIATDKIRQATSDLQEIIKLRGELGVNSSRDLPSTAAGAADELQELRGLKQLAEEITQEFEDAARAKEQHLENFQRELDQIRNTGRDNLINMQEELELFGVVDVMEQRRIQNHFEILRLKEQMARGGFTDEEIAKAEELARVESARTLELQRILDIKQQIKDAEAFGLDLQGELDQLQGVNAELSVYEETLRKIETVYKDISPAQKQYLLDLAKQIDAQKEFNKTVDVLEDVLTDLVEGNWKGIFDSLLGELKRFLVRAAAEWLTSKFWKLLTGQSSSSGGGSGGILGALGGLFGGGGSGGGGTPGFNPNSFRSLGGISFGGSGATPESVHGAVHSAHGGAGGGLNLPGIFAGIGIGADILGGLIGGKAGSVISSVGSGIATGAAIGSIIPGVGTVIGAVVGGIAGFFSSIFGSKKRKIDKKENLPKLQQGLAEAMRRLRSLAADKNAIFNDPDGAISAAMELRQQIASGFGIQFQSKKYRKIGQQRIQQNLAEADRLIADMQKLKDRALTARSVDEQLNASFAGGVFMSREFQQFRRRNGMLPGTFTGRDTLPSLLADGEMVLNPAQIRSVINTTGFDPFSFANIPNYQGGTALPPSPSASPAIAASSAPIILQPNIQIIMEGEGVSNVQIKAVVIDGLRFDDDVQVELVEAYDKKKKRTR